ncbi:hypothetical protein LTR72_011979 [Exophiala xenobiotica]|nr:hypothetical protein LTR72_011979 [Exophiala xenobiotica]
MSVATATAPLGPRAMVQNGTAESWGSTWDRAFHSLAMRSYPRLALFEALAGFKDAHKQREPSEDDICEARRDFMDSFAYMCDTEKGGATVTATGLQKLLSVLWSRSAHLD